MIVRPLPTRRHVLTATAMTPVAPMVWTRRAAAQQLVVRTRGGAYDEVKKRTVYGPFRAATGIEIVPVPSTVAKLLAMFRAGQVEINVIDTADDALLQLEQSGAGGDTALQGFQIRCCKVSPTIPACTWRSGMGIPA